MPELTGSDQETVLFIMWC